MSTFLAHLACSSCLALCLAGLGTVPAHAQDAEPQGTGTAEPASNESTAISNWTFSLTPYVWAAGLKGSVAPFPGAPEGDVDVSFKDIFQHLDLAGMLVAEVRYRRFGGYMDLVYTSVSGDEDLSSGLPVDNVEAENGIFIGTFGLSYRALETNSASIDLLAGARLWSVTTEVELSGDAFVDQDFEHTETWVDPVIGFQARYQFENGIFLTSLAQVGGFGVGSDLTWDALGAIGYQFNDSISVIAGYRHLEVDYDRNGFVFDTELSGPAIGMTIRF